MPSSTKHLAMQSGKNAVISGGANGIGLAAAAQFLQFGMNVVIADNDEEQLKRATESLSQNAPGNTAVKSQVCDVSNFEEVQALKKFTADTLGDVSILMNNAGSGMNPGKPWENVDQWKHLIDINLGGVLHGVQAFVPDMLAKKQPGIVINTGSKQGITRPPGNAAYNLTKTGVISYTESLSYEFRQEADCALTAHLLVPGFTYTGMISRFLPEKPEAAWTSEQVVDFMLEKLQSDDFYIICPDNDVTRETDERRMQWYMDDLIKNRPALSRWHEEYAAEFEAFMARPRT
jgi:NAD(P)-dependent dehydrogenase (short-subunit alcohol dehydrogenase family)